jgi:DNA-binding transcriptional regulator YiaG
MHTAAVEEALARAALPEPAVRRAVREGAGVSQRSLARALGVSAQAVNFWEAGKRTPSARYVARYVSLLAQLAHVREVIA